MTIYDSVEDDNKNFSLNTHFLIASITNSEEIIKKLKFRN